MPLPNKPNFRVSITLLEKFRRYHANQSSYDTEKALMDALQGVFLGTDKTTIGTAYHSQIEKSKYFPMVHQGTEYAIISQKGITNGFDREVPYIGLPIASMMPIFEYSDAHYRMFKEIPISKMYSTRIPGTGEIGFCVSGRCDGIEGITIRDAKFKFRDTTDISEYTESMQWKLSLDITEAKMFCFDLFTVENYEGWPLPVNIAQDPTKSLRECVFLNPDIRIVAQPEIRCTPHDQLRSDIDELLFYFADWLHFRGLFNWLKPCDDHGRTIQPVPA